LAAVKSKGEIVLIVTIVGFVAVLAFMLPPVREFLFHHGAEVSAAQVAAAIPAISAVAEEYPRNKFPMMQYTIPSIFRKMRYVVDDKTRGKHAIYYYWYGPQGIPAGTKLPLVIVLHDHAGVDIGAVYLRSSAVQKEFPSFLLIPQAPVNKVWSSPKKYSGQEFTPPQAPAPLVDASLQSIPDVVELAQRLIDAAAIDENRVYIIGCDEGGTGVYGALANYPGFFAGGVEAGGTWSFTDAGRLAKTPLLLLQGLNDTTVTPDYTRTMDQIVKNVGGKIYLGEFKSSGHECESPNYYTHAVWQWLFSQRRVPAPPPPAPPPKVVSTPAAPAAPVAQ
jgi:predicted peptidase